MDQQKTADLKFVMDKIRQYLPRLVDFLDNDSKLSDYSKKLYQHQAAPVHLERQKPCVRIINDKLSKLFPPEELARFSFNFENGIVSNVVDHHNILNHPLLVSGLIISNLHKLLTGNTGAELVLTCGGVPFSNNFHKRGFTFNKVTFPFVTGKDTDRILHFFPYKKLEFLPLAEKRKMLDDFTPPEIDFLREYEKNLTADDVKAGNFLDQITLLNRKLFPKMFAPEMRDKIPQIVFFECEYLANELLKDLIRHGDGFMYKTLFHGPTRDLVIKTFEGIWGAWNKEQNLGSHFFWLADGKGGEIALELKDGYLVPKKAGFDPIKLDAQTLLSHLDRGTLRPSIFMFYGVLLFYCGIKPLTGLGSMNYLSDMQEAWIKVLSQIEPEEADLVSKMDMKGLIVSPNVLYARDENGKIMEQYFADLVFKGGLTKDYLQHLADMRFNDLLNTSMISNYEIKVPAEEKRPLSVTIDDLVNESFSWIK